MDSRITRQTRRQPGRPPAAGLGVVLASVLATMLAAGPQTGWTQGQAGGRTGAANGPALSGPIDYVLVELEGRAVAGPSATPVAPPTGGPVPPPALPPASDAWRVLRVPTMQYQPGRSVNGFSGCNRYSARIRAPGRSPAGQPQPLLPQIALTKMACAPEAMKLERGLVGALSRTVRIVGAGGDLIFVDARGDRLARFRSISARIIPR